MSDLKFTDEDVDNLAYEEEESEVVISYDYVNDDYCKFHIVDGGTDIYEEEI